MGWDGQYRVLLWFLKVTFSIPEPSSCALMQGHGILRGESPPRLVVDEAVASSELAGWESLEGCYVYYTPTSGMQKCSIHP